jgi:hypothetical protein
LQQHFVQAVLAQPLPETHQSGFIRHGVLQTQADKTPPAQAVGHQFLALRVGQPVAMLEQAHFEKHQRRTGRSSRAGRIHRLQGRLQRLPVQRLLQPGQKIVGGGGRHQAVEQSELGIGRRLHILLTVNQTQRSKSFCRGLIKCILSVPESGYESTAIS